MVDVVVVGGGHNGLVCACYLAAAGLSVRVLERRPVIGGAAVTEEFHPGFRNSAAAYTVSLLQPKVIQDLELHRHGLRIVKRRMANFWPLGPGDCLALPGDLAGAQKEFARFSPRDAENAPAYYAAIERLADVLRGLVLESPPNVGGGWAEALKGLRLGNRLRGLDMEDRRLLLDIFTKSVADFLGLWFESDTVRAALAFDGVVGSNVSPHTPGTAYILMHHAFGEVNGERGAWGHAIGGMGAITQAMAAAARERGVVIETETPVARVLVEHGAVTGVALENGRQVRARAVAANVNPKMLFLELVESGCLPAEFRTRMENYRCESGTFRMNVALSELPDFTCRPGRQVQDHHTAGIVIGPTIDYLDRAWSEAREHGWSRRPIIEMVIPSTLDDTLAPPGCHVASLFCQHFAYDLPGGRSWKDCRQPAADLVIDTVNEYAPNFRDSIVGRQILSPLDLERRFGLTGGDIFHGTLTLDQLFSARPVLGYADYRSPVRGLYLCGSGAHPGGGVTGAPGHNAAREIARDFRRGRNRA